MADSPLNKVLNFFKSIWKVFRRLFKFVFYTTVFFCVIFLVLGNIGGNSDNLKLTIENYISDATGYQARIDKLNNFKFFPTIVLDFEGLSLDTTAAGEGESLTSETVAQVGHVNVRMGFISTMLGQGRVKVLDVENIQLKKGLVSKKAITVKNIGIEDNDAQADAANLLASGTIGSDAFKARVGLQAFGSEAARTYGLGDGARKLHIALADITLDGLLNNRSGDLSLQDFTVTQGKTTLASGEVTLASVMGGHAVTGDIRFGKSSEVIPDITLGDQGQIKGRVTFPQVKPAELAALGAVATKLQNILALKSEDKSDAPIDLSALDVDLTLDIEKLLLESETPLGAQTVSIKVKDGAAKIAAPQGTLAGGASDFSVSLTPQAGQSVLHDLKIAFDVNDLSVEQALAAAGQSQNVSVSVDGDVALKATLKTWADLPARLNGQVTLTSEQGEFEARWLNVWGDGLASLILPSLKPSQEAALNCAIVHAGIKDGIATFSPFYIDGQHVRVGGEGTYDMVADNMKLRLKPESKDVSIGDLSAAIKVRGPLGKLSVKPDAVDVGKKAASMLLGSVNPAFLVLGSTNLGNVVSEAAGLDQDKMPDLCPALSAVSAQNKAAGYAKTLQSAAGQ